MKADKKTTWHLSGRVRGELVDSYSMVRDAGYTDTESINEGIRALSRQVQTCDQPQV